MAAGDRLLLLAIAVTLTCPTCAVTVGIHNVRYREQLYKKTDTLNGVILAEESASSSVACANLCLTKSSECKAVAYNKVSQKCQLIAVNQGATTKFNSSSELKLFIEVDTDTSAKPVDLHPPAVRNDSYKVNVPGKSWRQIGSSCYCHITESLDWLTAKLRCEVMGGTLAAITTADEHLAIVSWLVAEGNTGQLVWIGGSDIAVEGEWQWVTGEAFVYEEMSNGGSADGGTVQNCLTISMYNQAWNDYTCGSTLSDTVCEKQCR
ncbi:ladderlectin-like [Mya arenaria]|uniref:ladderlectin-like n=1 Tax=Mya arenaria TaxID=6604 RepID=UPI0022E4A213|nr:ladderlectin-like [Mya arenaria]